MYQFRLCVTDRDDLWKYIMKRHMVLKVPFIRVPPKCIVMFKISIGCMVLIGIYKKRWPNVLIVHKLRTNKKFRVF